VAGFWVDPVPKGFPCTWRWFCLEPCTLTAALWDRGRRAQLCWHRSLRERCTESRAAWGVTRSDSACWVNRCDWSGVSTSAACLRVPASRQGPLLLCLLTELLYGMSLEISPECIRSAGKCVWGMLSKFAGDLVHIGFPVVSKNSGLKVWAVTCSHFFGQMQGELL